MRVRVRVRAAAHATRVVRVEGAEVVHLSVQSGRVLSEPMAHFRGGRVA